MQNTPLQSLSEVLQKVDAGIPKSVIKKITAEARAEAKQVAVPESYENLDQIHENSEAKEHLLTGQEQARNEKSNPGKNGNTPPNSGRFKPGQSGNPSGRPAATVTRLVRTLLAANEDDLARKVAKAWVEQATKGKQAALIELLKRVDGIPPDRATREDIFYGLPPGSMAKTRKRTSKNFRE